MLALALSPQYQATADVLVSPQEELGSNVQIIEFTLPTVAQQARTAQTEAAARERLPPRRAGTRSSVSVRPNVQTLTLEITASSPSRDVVVPLANAYADQVVQRQGDQDLVSLSLLRPATFATTSSNLRYVFLVAGIAMGVVLGIFAVLAASARYPRASRSGDLRAIGLRPLGAIPSCSRFATEVMASPEDQDRLRRLALRLDGALARHELRAVALIDLDGSSRDHVECLVRAFSDCGKPAIAINAPGGVDPSAPLGRFNEALESEGTPSSLVLVSSALPAGAPTALGLGRAVGSVVLTIPRGRHKLKDVDAVAAELSAAGVRVLGALFTDSLEPMSGRASIAPSARTPRSFEVAHAGARRETTNEIELETGEPESTQEPPTARDAGPSRTQKTAKNAGYVFLQTGLPPLLNVLLLPILVRELGPVGYGLFAAFQSIFILNSLFDLGLSKSIVRYTATYFAAGQLGAISRFVSTAFTVFLGLGAVAMAFAVVFAAFGLGLIGVPASLEDEAVIACLIFGFAGLYNLPAGTLGGVMGGLKLHGAESKIHVGVAVVQATAMATAALSGAGLVAVVFAFHAPNFVKPWIRLPLIRRLLPDFRVSPRLFDRALLREMGTYSVWAFLVDSGRRIVESIDPIIVSAFIGLATVTPYAIGLQVGRLLQRMTLPIAFVLLPVASELEAIGDRRTTRRLILRATRYTCALALGLALPLLIMAEDVIRVWLGEDYPLAVDVSRIFLVVSVILMVRAPLVNVLESSHRGVRYAGSWVLAESALNIVLSLVLLHPFGARGVVLSTLVAVSVGTLLGIGPAALKMYGISPWAVIRASILPNAIPLAIALPVWLFAAWLAHDRGLVAVLMALFTSVAVYLLVFWRTLPADDRRELGGPLRRKLGLGGRSLSRPMGPT